MKHVPTLALYKVPKGLSPEWKKVFTDLVGLLRTVRCYLFDSGLAQGCEQTLINGSLSMDRSKRELLQTLERLYGVAPRTHDVGWAILNATSTIVGLFGNYRHWQKSPEPPQASEYPDRSAFFQFVRDLREQRDSFPERQILLELHEAVMAEKRIPLAVGKKAGRKPDENKAKIVIRVRKLQLQGMKWRSIYAKINEEFGTDYEYSRSGSLQKLLLEKK